MQNREARYRHELKYLVSGAELALLRGRAAPLLRPDPHAGSGGMYAVRSLYFDDWADSCLRDKEDGTDPREKFRLRIYNRSSALILLECKRKERGMTLKSAVELSPETARSLIEGRSPGETEALPPLLRRMKLQADTRLLRPAVIVDYDRIAYVGALGHVRVTFDMNLRSSSACGAFFTPTLPMRPVMPAGQHLLEVKYDEFLPDPVYRALNLGTLRQTACSKYALCRRCTL